MPDKCAPHAPIATGRTGVFALLDVSPALLDLPTVGTAAFRAAAEAADGRPQAVEERFRDLASDGSLLAEPLAAFLKDRALDEVVKRAEAIGQGEADRLAHAGRIDRDGRTDDARDLLLAALLHPPSESDGALGLAVLALRDGDRRGAAAFAGRCLELGGRHPRACILFALGEHEAGRIASAQAHLAAAARIARAHPELAEDMRGAQRMLLTMQLEQAPTSPRPTLPEAVP